MYCCLKRSSDPHTVFSVVALEQGPAQLTSVELGTWQNGFQIGKTCCVQKARPRFAVPGRKCDCPLEAHPTCVACVAWCATMTIMHMLPIVALVAAVAGVVPVNAAASDARPDMGLPIVPPSDKQQCTLYDVQCTPNSTFAPSWCMYQNVRGLAAVVALLLPLTRLMLVWYPKPLIVPRPPVALVNHSAAMAGYAPRYACHFDHGKHYGQAFQQCQLITNVREMQQAQFVCHMRVNVVGCGCTL